MTNNDMNDIDVDNDGDFDKNEVAKTSLKETWQNNPVLKIAAVVLVGAVLVGGYMTFMGGSEDETKAQVGGVDASSVKVTPGKSTPDLAYTEALKEQNQQAQKQAEQGGDSFMPLPIAAAEDGGIQIPEIQQTQKANPLEEWRQRAEAKRIEMEEKAVEEDEVPQPDVVPVVAPVRPQPSMKQDPKAGEKLAKQMRVVIAAQAPVKPMMAAVTDIPSPYTVMVEEERKLAAEQEEAGGSGKGGSGGDGAEGGDAKVIVAAGSILYAQLINELNSDVKGPALAQVLSGPFRGGRALGTFEKQEEYLTLIFNRIIKDGVVYDVNGIALDEDTTLPAHQTEVDHHYWSRVILPAAAAFVQGYASAVAETGQSTTTTAGGGVATEQPEPDSTEELYKGLESAAGTVSSVLKDNAKKDITVIVAKGTTMGILFMDSITTDSITD